MAKFPLTHQMSNLTISRKFHEKFTIIRNYSVKMTPNDSDLLDSVPALKLVGCEFEPWLGNTGSRV